ncbi:MAG: 2'-5' RNA ligase family protein [Patescibacteria group bacterium]|nr:2'-5' RNA ligase family protein [Patescibacteria group bacterium]MCL5224103.1 2'-5' RNA ligase family protein [Patescibacteria group bacterium]
MSHRVFVAIPISDSLQERIVGWEKDVLKIPVRFLKGKDLHVTVLPPWYVDDIANPEKILKKEASKHGRFTVVFNKVSFGPNIYQPRLVWAEGTTTQNMIELHDGLSKAFHNSDEIRPYKLHLTLARFRMESFPTFPIKKLEEKILWSEDVDSIVMMESHLYREGASYEIVSRVLLR